MVALVAAAAARKRRESEEGLVETWERNRTSAWVTPFIGACLHTHLDYDQVPLFLKCTLALYLSTVGCPFGFIRRSTSKRETRLLHPQIPFIIPSLIGTFQRERELRWIRCRFVPLYHLLNPSLFSPSLSMVINLWASLLALASELLLTFLIFSPQIGNSLLLSL